MQRHKQHTETARLELSKATETTATPASTEAIIESLAERRRSSTRSVSSINTHAKTNVPEDTHGNEQNDVSSGCPSPSPADVSEPGGPCGTRGGRRRKHVPMKGPVLPWDEVVVVQTTSRDVQPTSIKISGRVVQSDELGFAVAVRAVDSSTERRFGLGLHHHFYGSFVQLANRELGESPLDPPLLRKPRRSAAEQVIVLVQILCALQTVHDRGVSADFEIHYTPEACSLISNFVYQRLSITTYIVAVKTCKHVFLTCQHVNKYMGGEQKRKQIHGKERT